MTHPTIADYMTASPHTIGLEQTLSNASRRMHEHGIRHLPVLHGGELRGILSSRDIALVEALDGADPETVTVEEAMSAETYVVAPTETLASVVGTMADRKYGAAVVMIGREVVGIFTTIDALRALRERL
ncbi:MAG: CBS domain-containing protein [Sandaracinaceae bacterium]